MKKTATGNWFAVYRGNTPIAMFQFFALATEWINSAAHRSKDRVFVVPVVDGKDLPPHIVLRAHRHAEGKCVKCGEPAEKYSDLGGFSVQCQSCNEAAAVKRNAASARRRGSL